MVSFSRIPKMYTYSPQSDETQGQSCSFLKVLFHFKSLGTRNVRNVGLSRGSRKGLVIEKQVKSKQLASREGCLYLLKLQHATTCVRGCCSFKALIMKAFMVRCNLHDSQIIHYYPEHAHHDHYRAHLEFKASKKRCGNSNLGLIYWPGSNGWAGSCVAPMSAASGRADIHHSQE